MPPVVTNVIRVRATPQGVLRVLSRLGSVVTGSPGGAGGAVRALQVRIGLAALDRISKAFVTKARGETDEAGESWPDLSPHTKAYTRRHPGVPKKRPFWDTHPSITVTQKRREEWWEIYYAGRRKGRSKRHSASVAWIILRQRYPGIRTLMDKYGDAKVEILRDADVLLNSLSPGVPADTAPPTPPRQPNQVFRCLPGEVILGTNRKGAADNHRGIPGRLPRRRLWPDPSRWPSSWHAAMLTQALKGMVRVVQELLGSL